MKEKCQRRKKMKNNILIYVILVFLSLLILAGMVWCTYQYPIEVVKTDTVFSTKTDTLWKDTTIYEKEIKEKKVVEIKRDTVYTEKGDTVQLITEAKTFEKSIISDKDTADLQIYTSGINTALDSLKMRLKTHKEVITNTVEVTKIVEKKKTVWDKISIGLQGGYGYTFNSREFQPYIGVGIGINL